jgi:hypothetical protein
VSVDSELVLFNGTSGKSIKRATDTGIATLTSGVLSATTPAALTKTDDTNVTLTLGGTPTTALLAATSITAGWTGQLSLARGGTGANLSDPGANKIMGWDDTDNSVGFWTVGSNLSYDHATHTLSASAGSAPTTSKVTGSDFTTTSNSFVDVTGLTFSASASSMYYFEANLLANSADTSGAAFTITFDAGGGTNPDQFVFTTFGTAGTNTTATDWQNTLQGVATVFLQKGASNFGLIEIRGIVRTVSAGTLKVQCRKQVTGGTLTVYVNSFLSVTSL